MTVEWRESENVTMAATTRPVRTANGEIVRFAREALDGMAEQVNNGFVPIVIEHFTLLPPAGRWREAVVVEADDGHHELILRGRLFRTLSPVGADPDPWGLLTNDRPVATIGASIGAIALEPRNFDEATLADAKARAPVQIQEEHRWSELPPLEWIIEIGVAWGAIMFAGSFLEQLGGATARGILDWISNLSTAAKDPERDQIVTLQFELPGGNPIGPLVYGFISVDSGADIPTIALPAIEAATPIAELAGAQVEHRVFGDLRRAAFFWKAGEWHLGWWVADDDAVRVTNWFVANAPDAARFLGRPLLPDP
jgi:hypothetical protein